MSNGKKYLKKRVMSALFVTLAAVVLLAGCTSDADRASENLSTAAEQFEVQRSVVGVNGITDKVAFYVEGRCSIDPSPTQLIITCKQGPDDYRKHYIGLSDNVYYVVTQLEPIDVSVYHTRVVIKPENLLPEFDIETGKQ